MAGRVCGKEEVAKRTSCFFSVRQGKIPGDKPFKFQQWRKGRAAHQYRRRGRLSSPVSFWTSITGSKTDIPRQEGEPGGEQLGTEQSDREQLGTEHSALPSLKKTPKRLELREYYVSEVSFGACCVVDWSADGVPGQRTEGKWREEGEEAS